MDPTSSFEDWDKIKFMVFDAPHVITPLFEERVLFLQKTLHRSTNVVVAKFIQCKVSAAMMITIVNHQLIIPISILVVELID